MTSIIRVIFMEDHIPVRPDRNLLFYFGRLINGLYGLWPSMKITPTDSVVKPKA